jgi:hypothetical protein
MKIEWSMISEDALCICGAGGGWLGWPPALLSVRHGTFIETRPLGSPRRGQVLSAPALTVLGDFPSCGAGPSCALELAFC